MNKVITSIAIVLAISSCSVYRSYKNEGASVKQIQDCKEQTCFESLPKVKILETKASENGEKTIVYKVPRKKEDNEPTAKAIVYLSADLTTLGLWEIAGTPLEGYLSDKDSIVFETIYNNDGSLKKLLIQDTNSTKDKL